MAALLRDVRYAFRTLIIGALRGRGEAENGRGELRPGTVGHAHRAGAGAAGGLTADSRAGVAPPGRLRSGSTCIR